MPKTDSTVAETDRTAGVMAEWALMPWTYAQAWHEWQTIWCHWLAEIIFAPAYPPHPHEAEFQLEIPEPIEAAGEDLFA